MKITINKFKKSDSKEVSDFIIKIFKEFDAKGLSMEAIEFFSELYKKENIEKKWTKDHVIIIRSNKSIMGVGRAKKDGWITHCYVDKNYMGKGIGSILMKKLELWIRNVMKKDKILLNSSPFALQFYKKLGYTEKGKKKMYHGIPLHQMIK